MSYQGSLEELKEQLYKLQMDLINLVSQNPNLYSWCLQPLIDSLSQSITEIDQYTNNAPRDFKNYNNWD